jgi:hypothetical protein
LSLFVSLSLSLSLPPPLCPFSPPLFTIVTYPFYAIYFTLLNHSTSHFIPFIYPCYHFYLPFLPDLFYPFKPFIYPFYLPLLPTSKLLCIPSLSPQVAILVPSLFRLYLDGNLTHSFQ